MTFSEFKYNINQGDVLYDIVDFKIVRYRYWDVHPFYSKLRVLVDDELKLVCVPPFAFHKLYFKKLRTLEDAEKELIDRMKERVDNYELKQDIFNKDKCLDSK